MKTFRQHIVESAWRSCCDSPNQRGQAHIKGCKHYSPSEQDRYDDMEKHNVATIPGYKRRLPEETLHESLHDVLTKVHGFKHKEVHPEGWRSSHSVGTDHYETSEMIEPTDTHKILTKAGYTHLTRSKADSRVSLDPYVHYEKEQMGSRHSVTVHHDGGDGEVSHITAKHHVVRD